MSRIRVEGLLAAFPKLVGTGKQHTYVETENVRYVYQPLEGMYLLLITNKQSNILEDLETLRLLSKVVSEYVPEVDESTTCECAFELLFAFDEVISLGHKEEVTIAQVRQNTEMESNEEKLHKMIIQSKIDEVNAVMKNKAKEIDLQKLDRKAGGGAEPWKTSAMGRVDDMMGGSANPILDDGPSFKPAVSSMSDRMHQPGPTKGMMKLGKSVKKNDILSALAKEGEAVDTASTLAAPSAPAPVVPTEPVTVGIEELMTVRMNKEGGLEAMEVQGTLTLLVTDQEHAKAQLELSMGANAGVQFKTHPHIDKAAYNAQAQLGTRDGRPFPVGVPQGVLKWRFQTSDESRVPIALNCWPTASGAETYINIEYESAVEYDLQQVVIAIPGISRAPTVNTCDGDWRFDPSGHCVKWTIDLVDDSNRTGNMELVVDAAAAEGFFPCSVQFNAKTTICDIAVPRCVNTETGSNMRFACSKVLKTAKFEVVY